MFDAIGRCALLGTAARSFTTGLDAIASLGCRCLSVAERCDRELSWNKYTIGKIAVQTHLPPVVATRSLFMTEVT